MITGKHRMASAILSLTVYFFLLVLHAHAQTATPAAQAPPAPPPINLTGILDEVGQFTTFIRLLTLTQVDTQVSNQLGKSIEGVTVFAPTDNAFNNLEPGTLNRLSAKQQLQLVMYHVAPKFYTWNTLLLVSNPVMTLATGQDGLIFGLNFTSEKNQFNVSSGVVEANIDVAVRKEYPLAIYQVNKVLLPEELFGTKVTTPSITPVINPTNGSESTEVAAAQPVADSVADDGSASTGIKSVRLWFVIGVSICMGVLF